MITIEEQSRPSGHLLVAAVFGEFALADYRDFERAVVNTLERSGERVDLILDLHDMTGFTVDVAWEEIRFSRSHPRDFRKIAVVTESVWISWSAWISRLFVEADFQVFEDFETAAAWISEAGAAGATPLSGGAESAK